MDLHLHGNNAPVGDERDAVPSRVVGSIPADLRGRFYRNGPNPRSGWSPHLYAGDGMVHMVEMDGGAALGYRNRYVRTPLFEHPGADRRSLALDPATGRIDPRVTTANTHVVDHAGRLLALEEGGLPYELTPALATVGPYTFDGRLTTAMTAHPKRDPDSGELAFFGYSVRPPHLTYHVAEATGALRPSLAIDLPACSLMHDFAVTATKAVFVDSCLVFDPRAVSSGSPWRWDDDHGARIGVMDRDRGGVRWFEVEPCHLSHVANAHDEPGGLLLLGTRLARGEGGTGGLPVLHEWRIDLDSGAVAERPLAEVSSEYPRLPDALVGRPHRFVYSSGFWFEAAPHHGEIHKHEGDRITTRRLAPGHTCGEPVFVARRAGRAEDDGYLLTFAHDRVSGTSYLLILDATDLSTRAEVHLPLRVPAGFHGTWLAAPA